MTAAPVARILLAALFLAGCGRTEQAANQAAAPRRPAGGGAPAASNQVAAAAQAAAPKAAPARNGPWSASGYALNGAEPFWGGTLTGTSLRYMTPENQFGDVIATTAAYGATQEVYRGSLGGRPFVLTLTRGPCSNGMSDHSFAFAATLAVRGETRRGCADAQ